MSRGPKADRRPRDRRQLGHHRLLGSVSRWTPASIRETVNKIFMTLHALGKRAMFLGIRPAFCRGLFRNFLAFLWA
jgi:hypothetical protein